MSASAARPRVPAFYERALGGAEHAELLEAFQEAHRERGLEGEAALLRALLRTTLQRQPEDWDLLLSGVRLLVNVLLAQHRLSGQQAEDLVGSLAGVVERVEAMFGGSDAAA